MIETAIDFPAEDSPDMTPDELDNAIEAKVALDMVPHLSELKCQTCSGPVTLLKQQLRRRAPHLYARVLFVCQNGHQGRITFRARFLGGI